MLNRPAMLFFMLFVLSALIATASPKEKSTTQFQVVTVRTRIHGSSSGTIFTYTDELFAQVNGKRLVYECAQRGDICPVLESGRTYTGDLEGPYLYISMSLPDGQKDLNVKFKRVGSW